MSVGLLLLILFLFLLGSGFFSGMETGLVSINRVRLRHLLKRKQKQALQLAEFLKDPDTMLATTLIGTNICNTALTVLGTGLAIRLVGGNEQLGNTVSSIGVALIILVFGEYLPKAWFQSHPIARTGRYVGLLRFFNRLFLFISVPVTGLVRVLVPNPPHHEDDENLTREDMVFLLSRESGATPTLNEQRRGMVHGVFKLAEKQASDVMIAREEMIHLAHDASMSDIRELAARTRIKSFPVYSNPEQRFTGILRISDIFAHLHEENFDWHAVLRPPQYVEADLQADDLLPRIRFCRQPMLLIRNEQDRVIGFVTTEVVLEEIVGPLYEE